MCRQWNGFYLVHVQGRSYAEAERPGPQLQNIKIMETFKAKMTVEMFGEEMLNWASTSKHTTLRPWCVNMLTSTDRNPFETVT